MMKRFFDIILSGIAIVFLSPILVPVIIILKLTGEHYIFYKQERIGLNGEHFGLLKFATMLKDSPKIGSGDITLKNDPRVLPFGKFLRKTKINELPQLINVLLGDMSIIGPRPLTDKNFNYYSEETKAILYKMKPGLSGIGSVVFRDEESLLSNISGNPSDYYKEYIAPYKGQIEKWYYINRTIIIDFIIILLTVYIIVFPGSDIVFKTFKTLPNKPFYLEKK